MMTPVVMIDGNRHTFLVLNPQQDPLEAVTISRGVVEIISFSVELWGFMNPIERSPEDLARVYLSTTLDKTPQALNVLRGILNLGPIPIISSGRGKAPRKPRQTIEGRVTLGEICSREGWNSSDARRMLRKANKKVGESWDWEKSQEDGIVEFLRSALETIKSKSSRRP